MKTLFNAIKTRMESAEVQALFIGLGLDVPSRVILYHREYEEEEKDHLPPRPYLSVELGEVNWEVKDAVKEGPAEVIVHIVQDVKSPDEQTDALLDYPDAVVQALDMLRIQGDVLAHSATRPDHNLQHYYVQREVFTITLTRAGGA